MDLESFTLYDGTAVFIDGKESGLYVNLAGPAGVCNPGADELEIVDIAEGTNAMAGMVVAELRYMSIPTVTYRNVCGRVDGLIKVADSWQKHQKVVAYAAAQLRDDDQYAMAIVVNQQLGGRFQVCGGDYNNQASTYYCVSDADVKWLIDHSSRYCRHIKVFAPASCDKAALIAMAERRNIKLVVETMLI